MTLIVNDLFVTKMSKHNTIYFSIYNTMLVFGTCIGIDRYNIDTVSTVRLLYFSGLLLEQPFGLQQLFILALMGINSFTGITSPESIEYREVPWLHISM